MKAYHSLIVFMFIVACAALSSMHSYRSAEREMVADMSQALMQTLAEKSEMTITPDTILTYRSHLRIMALREKSIVYYAMNGDEGMLSTRPMRWKNQHSTADFQAFAHCSVASVFAFSDQRLPLSFSAMALLWAIFSIGYFKRHRKGMIVFGHLMFSEAENRFYTLKHQSVKLTPMQHALLLMFFRNPHHQLSKQDICDALWPKKPDANDTLYTLIKRIKPVLEAEGRLKITSERGRDYRLEVIE